ncbi:hypothetical protein Glove_193g65 [Diversispora epigaea]|uniref:Uncharacterized protein n=1 Tax=Diversispora epigaea TaxID=1348612 RepID=A0A397ILK2_9GLOM|nr:hypothetical protein Glove_193g65 [Diversispora epigaea]
MKEWSLVFPTQEKDELMTRIAELERYKTDTTNLIAENSEEDDAEALRVEFQPASENFIPNEKFEEFPGQQYVCSKVDRDMLDKAEFEVQEISDFQDRKVRTFFFKLHNITRNLPGTPESKTGEFVDNLLHIPRLDD